MRSSVAFLLFALVSCASKNPLAGKYAGLYELNVSEHTNCHFLMKKEARGIPTVLCHDADQAWVVPMQDYQGSVWLLAPLLTQSETILTFLEVASADKTSLLVSTDKGRNWDIYSVLKKKSSGDQIVEARITLKGKISVTYKDQQSKTYTVEQEASFKSKFTPLKAEAKKYPEICFSQHTQGQEQKIPPQCLSGYITRLLSK